MLHSVIYFFMIFFDKTLFHAPSGFHCFPYPQHHSSTQHDLRFPNAYIIALITMSLKQLVSDQCPDISRIQDFLKKQKAVSVGFTWFHPRTWTPLQQPIASWWGDPVGYVEHGKLAGVVADQERCQRFRQWPEWCHYKTSELESIMINYDHIVSVFVLHCVACVLFGCPLLGVHMLKPLCFPTRSFPRWVCWRSVCRFFQCFHMDPVLFRWSDRPCPRLPGSKCCLGAGQGNDSEMPGTRCRFFSPSRWSDGPSGNWSHVS